MKRVARILLAIAALTCGLAGLGVGRDHPPDTIEKSGCCSHHKGVCGCEGNRAKCCDGTLSPSCGC